MYLLCIKKCLERTCVFLKYLYCLFSFICAPLQNALSRSCLKRNQTRTRQLTRGGASVEPSAANSRDPALPPQSWPRSSRDAMRRQCRHRESLSGHLAFLARFCSSNLSLPVWSCDTSASNPPKVFHLSIGVQDAFASAPCSLRSLNTKS